MDLDARIILRNSKEALRWRIFPEHRLAPDEFERRYQGIMTSALARLEEPLST